jgi:hypothetical protein
VVVLAKYFAEYLFEAFQGNSRQVFLVKALRGQVELFAKGFPVKEGLSVESEDVVGGSQDRGEVIHECPRPVEDEIADQGKRRRKRNTYAW